MASRVAVARARAAEPGGRLDRDAFAKELLDLTASGHDLAAQRRVMRRLQRLMPDPRDASAKTARDFGWAVAKLRQTLPQDTHRVEPLARFLAERGFRLRPDDKPAADAPGFQLHRKGFAEQLQTIAAAGGAVTPRQQRRLASMLRDLADTRDIFYAQWQLQKAMHAGALDAKAGKRLRSILDGKVNGRANFAEIAYEMRQARASGFDASSMQRIRSLLANSTQDPDALFYAKRLFEKHVRTLEQAANPGSQIPVAPPSPETSQRHARTGARTPTAEAADGRDEAAASKSRAARGGRDRQAAGRQPTERQPTERHTQGSSAGATPDATDATFFQQLRARFAQFLAPKLEGRLDKRAATAELRAKLQSGELDAREYRTLRAAALTSTSPAEYRQRLDTAHASLSQYAATAAAVQARYAELLSDTWEEFATAACEDTRDARGRVIETAEERAARHQRRAERIEELLVEKPQRRAYLQSRARLADTRSDVRTALSAARSPVEVVGLQARLAAAEAAAEDLDVPLEA